jgi:hypothetical protein
VPSANLAADPVWRKERARRAAVAAHDPQHAARKLVAAWPELDQATKAEIRALLLGAEVRRALLAVSGELAELSNVEAADCEGAAAA